MHQSFSLRLVPETSASRHVGHFDGILSVLRNAREKPIVARFFITSVSLREASLGSVFSQCAIIARNDYVEWSAPNLGGGVPKR